VSGPIESALAKTLALLVNVAALLLFGVAAFRIAMVGGPKWNLVAFSGLCVLAITVLLKVCSWVTGRNIVNAGVWFFLLIFSLLVVVVGITGILTHPIQVR
jgi:hypothetical protein